MLCMSTRMAVRTWIGLGALGVVSLVGCGRSRAPMQQQPMSTMAPGTGEPAEGGPVSGVREIHVNQDCLILQDSLDGVRGIRVPGARSVPGGEMDPAVCHLESRLTSNHVRGEVVNGTVQRSVVVVKEQEYMLQDEFQQPVVFVVEHAVPDGWKVNSDPAPTAMVGKVALFKVAVQPGQIMRLHVAEAHEIPLASPPGQ